MRPQSIMVLVFSLNAYAIQDLAAMAVRALRTRGGKACQLFLLLNKAFIIDQQKLLQRLQSSPPPHSGHSRDLMETTYQRQPK